MGVGPNRGSVRETGKWRQSPFSDVLPAVARSLKTDSAALRVHRLPSVQGDRVLPSAMVYRLGQFFFFLLASGVLTEI